VTNPWTLTASDGELLVQTGVTGRAARLGHRLTIAMNDWRVEVVGTGDGPTSVVVAVAVDSLEVLRGDGGLKTLSGVEKSLARSNALGSLDAGRWHEIRFHADDVEATEVGYRLAGELQIRGRARKHVVELRVDDLGECWRLSFEAVVRQTDFGVKPYSLFLGSVQVADDVTVRFSAERAKAG
jgi:polyisoprenoid-binding protein YceI